MVTIIPTWDLFILIFVVLIITYSFIIGRDQTVKITIATYVALLTADGIGNLMGQYIFGLEPIHPILVDAGVGGFENNYVAVAKVVAFSLLLIVLMLKGNFAADIDDGDSSLISLGITTVLGFLSSILIVCVVLVFISNGSFLMGLSSGTSDIAKSIYEQSMFARILIDYMSVWFILPALAFIIGSLSSE